MKVLRASIADMDAGRGIVRKTMEELEAMEDEYLIELCREIPNAETIAAMKEAEDIVSGRVQAKSYSSHKDMLDEVLDAKFKEECI